MIKLENVVKIYRSKSGASTMALDGVSMEFPASGMVFVLGKSGCGKSTLMNIIGGLDSATSGELLVNDVAIQDYKSSDYDSYRSQYISFIFQEYNLLDEYDVKSNINLALHLQGDRSKGQNKVSTALDKVGLKGFEDRRINEMSGGQKQRVAIARALVKNSSVILADEPTGNLDSKNAEEIFTLLKEVSREKLVIVVTHDSESAELYGDRIIEMSDGHILQDRLMKNALDRNVTTAEDPSMAKNRYVNSRSQSKTRNIGFGNTLKLSLSTIWRRKFRMIVTVVLFFITMTFFGVGISVNEYSTDDRLLELVGQYDVSEIRGQTFQGANIDYGVANKVIKYYGKENVNLLYKARSELKIVNEYFIMPGVPSIDEKYIGHMQYITEINTAIVDDYGFKVLEGGRIAESLNEINLSKYVADKMIEAGEIGSYKELFESDLKMDNYRMDVEVVGIIDTGIGDRIEVLKDAVLKTSDNDVEYDKAIAIAIDEEEYLSFAMSLMVSSQMNELIMTNDKRNEVTLSYKALEIPKGATQYEEVDKEVSTTVISESYYNKVELLNSDVAEGIIFASGFDSIEVGNCVVSMSVARGIASMKLKKVELTDEEVMSAIESGLTLDKIESNIVGVNDFIDKLKIVGVKQENNVKPDKNAFIFDTQIILSDDQPFARRGLLQVGGFNMSLGNDPAKDAVTVGKMNSSSSHFVSVYWSEIMNIRSADNIISTIGLLCMGLFGVFTLIMMLNFFVVMVSDSRAKVGIFRSMGMSNGKVFLMFMTMSLVVTLISLTIVLATLAPIFIGVNAIVNTAINSIMTVRMVAVSFAVVGGIVGLATGLTIIGTTLPIIKIIRSEPIDLINRS